ncbi:RNA polymerase sigma factor SigW [Paenibacillus apis]|uniref:RNA polymerase sigma factor SigW n=1 Tax=Paenibacillus apis TaxID=1792174 RepID=A0A919Y4I5_9BACL|nr:RNA polymerase sigma factor SigW [Paenibacillus apis]
MQGEVLFHTSILLWREGREIGEESEQFIRLLKKRDREAFETFVREYSPLVYRAAYSVLHDEQDAKDAAQETFLQAYKSLPDYRSSGFKTWLSRIAVNKAIDMKRKKHRRQEEHWDPAQVADSLPDREEDFVRRMVRKERSMELKQRITDLPPAHRQVVTSFYLEGKSNDSIAAELGQAPKTIESRLYRARAWIRKHWKEEDWK